MQASDPLERAYDRLASIQAFVFSNRGKAFTDVRDTHCRSVKEIEASQQTAIDEIEKGLSDAEEMGEELREGYARLRSEMDAMGKQMQQLMRGIGADTSRPKDEPGESLEGRFRDLLRKLGKEAKERRDAFDKPINAASEYWRAFETRTGDTIGMVEAPSRETAQRVFAKYLPKSLQWSLIAIEKGDFEAFSNSRATFAMDGVI